MSYRIGDDDDIAGEGDDEVSAEEIGAALSRIMMRRRGGVPGMLRSRPTGAKTPYGQPVLAHQREVRADLYQVMGLGAITNAAAGVYALSQVFIERFKPGRLLLIETAPGNLVNTIFVGLRPQSANLAAMPVAAFAPAVLESRIAFDVGEIGQSLVVNGVTVAAAQTIAGMSYGTAIRAV